MQCCQRPGEIKKKAILLDCLRIVIVSVHIDTAVSICMQTATKICTVNAIQT